MRITGGDLRGRVLVSPEGDEVTRPMPDRVKVALFNILRGQFEGQRVLDLFAGSGAVGLEAISRGAASCVFFDRDRGAVRILEQNVASLGVGARATVVTGDSLGPLAIAQCPKPVHVIFCDPPYALVKAKASWERIQGQLSRLGEFLDPAGFVVLRTPWPANHVEDAAPPAPVPQFRRKPKRSRRRIRLDEFLDPAEFARLQEEEAEAEVIAPEPAAAPAQGSPVDLKIPGLAGPETRTYGTMAVHLYARA